MVSLAAAGLSFEAGVRQCAQVGRSCAGWSSRNQLEHLILTAETGKFRKCAPSLGPEDHHDYQIAL